MCIRGEKTEFRIQKTEVRRQKSRKQKTEFRSLSPKRYRCSFLGCLAWSPSSSFPSGGLRIGPGTQGLTPGGPGVSRIDGTGRPGCSLRAGKYCFRRRVQKVGMDFLETKIPTS